MLPDNRRNFKINPRQNGVASDKQSVSVTAVPQSSYFFLTKEGPYLFRKEALPRKFVVLKIIKTVLAIVVTGPLLFFITVYPFIGGPSASRTIPAVVGTMILMVPFIPFIVLGLLEILKIKKIKREGQVLFGELIEIKAQVKGGSTKGPRPGFVVSVRFGFTSPEGEYINAKASAVREDLVGKNLAPARTPVVVIYLNRRSFLLL